MDKPIDQRQLDAELIALVRASRHKKSHIVSSKPPKRQNSTAAPAAVKKPA